MSIDQRALDAIADYAAGRISAIEARRRLGGVTFGELLRMVADAGLRLPQAPTAGREGRLAQARGWLFPHDGMEQAVHGR